MAKKKPRRRKVPVNRGGGNKLDKKLAELTNRIVAYVNRTFVTQQIFTSDRIDNSKKLLDLDRAIAATRKTQSHLIDVTSSYLEVISILTNTPLEKTSGILTKIYETKKVVMPDGSLRGKIVIKKYNFSLEEAVNETGNI